jgi:hypothetical protein
VSVLETSGFLLYFPTHLNFFFRIQQRNGRKTLTTVQGLSDEYDLKKIIKVIVIFAFFSVADPGSGAFLTPGSGMGKKIRIRIWDEQSESYFRELRNNFCVKHFKDISSFMRIRDPGWKKFVSEIRDGKIPTGIRDKHPGSATLHFFVI